MVDLLASLLSLRLASESGRCGIVRARIHSITSSIQRRRYFFLIFLARDASSVRSLRSLVLSTNDKRTENKPRVRFSVFGRTSAGLGVDGFVSGGVLRG